MESLTDYFKRTCYQSKYQLGARVFGKWNDIPFIGSVLIDRCLDGKNPEVVIMPDLPIIVDKKIYNIILVKHKCIELLKSYNEKTIKEK